MITPAPITIAETAHALKQAGVEVIRTGADKRPTEGQGWGNVRHPLELISSIFANADGVGALLGDRSGGLVDIDLDSAEAVKLWQHFQPGGAGWVFNRGTKDSEHHIYLAPGTKTEAFSFQFKGHDKKSMLIELRGDGNGDGHQTIMPPSLHHDSGTYRTWVRFDELTLVDGPELRQAVVKTAAASLLLRLYPSAGSRNEFAMALSGFLIVEAKWNQEDAEHFIEALASEAGDDDVANRTGCVAYTMGKTTDGQHNLTRGGKLAEFIGEDAVKALRKWLGVRKRKSETQSEILIQVVRGQADLWHNSGREAFATIPVAEHLETHAIRSQGFKLWLGERHFNQSGSMPSRQSVDDALSYAEGQALFKGQQIEPALRVGKHDNTLFIDLGNPAWEVVRVTPEGWAVIPNKECPVRFVRAAGAGALPRPLKNGLIELLWGHLNITDPDDRILAVAWLLGCFMPAGAYPGLALEGEAGSTKSSLTRALRRLVDPNGAQELATVPRNEDDLLVAAKNSRVVAFDNLRALPEWLSDGLCRLSTGGGIAKRKLYSDGDVFALNVARPWIVNGINRVIVADDLIDRAVIIRLSPVKTRQTEQEFWTAFDADAGAIFGALLKALSVALANFDKTNPDNLPRMADWAKWAVAAEPALPWKPGAFLKALDNNRRKVSDDTLAEDPLAVALLELVKSSGGTWTGSYAELGEQLWKSSYEWMHLSGIGRRNTRKLGHALHRLAKMFRERGFTFEFSDRGKCHVKHVSISAPTPNR